MDGKIDKVGIEDLGNGMVLFLDDRVGGGCGDGCGVEWGLVEGIGVWQVFI